LQQEENEVFLHGLWLGGEYGEEAEELLPHREVLNLEFTSGKGSTTHYPFAIKISLCDSFPPFFVWTPRIPPVC
jgi:hypothetical protein